MDVMRLRNRPIVSQSYKISYCARYLGNFREHFSCWLYVVLEYQKRKLVYFSTAKFGRNEEGVCKSYGSKGWDRWDSTNSQGYSSYAYCVK